MYQLHSRLLECITRVALVLECASPLLRKTLPKLFIGNPYAPNLPMSILRHRLITFEVQKSGTLSHCTRPLPYERFISTHARKSKSSAAAKEMKLSFSRFQEMNGFFYAACCRSINECFRSYTTNIRTPRSETPWYALHSSCRHLPPASLGIKSMYCTMQLPGVRRRRSSLLIQVLHTMSCTLMHLLLDHHSCQAMVWGQGFCNACHCTVSLHRISAQYLCARSMVILELCL